MVHTRRKTKNKNGTAIEQHYAYLTCTRFHFIHSFAYSEMFNWKEIADSNILVAKTIKRKNNNNIHHLDFYGAALPMRFIYKAVAKKKKNRSNFRIGSGNHSF